MLQAVRKSMSGSPWGSAVGGLAATGDPGRLAAGGRPGVAGAVRVVAAVDRRGAAAAGDGGDDPVAVADADDAGHGVSIPVSAGSGRTGQADLCVGVVQVRVRLPVGVVERG